MKGQNTKSSNGHNPA